LTYPHSLISLGFLQSDSSDTTFQCLQRHLPALRREFGCVGDAQFLADVQGQRRSVLPVITTSTQRLFGSLEVLQDSVVVAMIGNESIA
jgi:hypothetical protein